MKLADIILLYMRQLPMHCEKNCSQSVDETSVSVLLKTKFDYCKYTVRMYMR
jgi:hypothetical protein